MDVAALRTELRVALRDEVQPYLFSDSQLFSVLNDAYMEIQRESEYWGFHHGRQELIETAASTAIYARPAYRAVYPNSLYYIKDGETAKQPMSLVEYADWTTEEAVVTETASHPRDLVHAPDQQWIVDPVPDGIYRIYGDVWLNPTPFADENAEPMWEADFHGIVWMKAAEMFVSTQPEAPENMFINNVVGVRLPALKRAFIRRYLPSIRRAPAHA